MIVLLFLNLLFSSLPDDKLTSVKVTSNIKMMIPSGFRPMTDDEIVNKYFTTRKPVALYTDSDLIIDLGINKSSTNWRTNDLKIMMNFQKANIHSLYDEINMISEGIKEVKGKKVSYFEFESLIKPDENSFQNKKSIRKYTYIQYIIVGTTSWIFNFTCPIQLKDNWQEKVVIIMESIEIRDRK